MSELIAFVSVNPLLLEANTQNSQMFLQFVLSNKQNVWST